MKMILHIAKKVKVWLCLVIDKTINGHLHQQSFVLHHNKLSKQHRYPKGFEDFQNLDSFDFHTLYKLCKFQMPFEAIKKIVVQRNKPLIMFIICKCEKV